MGESERTGAAEGPHVERVSRLVLFGYVGAVLLPVLGLVAAAVLLSRGDRTSAGGVAVVSILSALLWVMFTSS